MLDAIRKAIAGYVDELKRVRLAIERVSREREDLLFAPPAKEDFLTALDRWQAANTERYRAVLVQRLADLRSNRDALDDPSSFNAGIEHLRLFNVHRFSVAGTAPTETTALEQSLLGLFGGAVYQVLRTEIGKLPQLPDEITSADRARRLVKVEAELSELQAKERELVSAAEESGIDVQAVG